MSTTEHVFWQADVCTGAVPCSLAAAVETFNGRIPSASFDVRQGSPIIVNYINRLDDTDLFRLDPFISSGATFYTGAPSQPPLCTPPDFPAAPGYVSPVAINTAINPTNTSYTTPAGIGNLANDPQGTPPAGASQSRVVVHLHGGHTPSYVDGEPDRCAALCGPRGTRAL